VGGNRRRLAALAAGLGLTLVLGAGPADGLARSGVAGAAGSTEQQPATTELAAQHAEVTRLRAEAKVQAAQVDDAQAALRGASRLAGAALEDYSIALHTLELRRQEQAQREGSLALARMQVEATRRELGRWAREAYSGGTGLGGNATVTTLLEADSSVDVDTNLTVLRRIGAVRSRELGDLVEARARADAATRASTDATDAAAQAAIEASDAREQAQAAVETQRRLVAVAETARARTDEGLTVAQERENGLRAAALNARKPATVAPARTGDNRVTGPTGTCTGGDAVQQYANGMIPAGVLCPLSAAPGHSLRADAAYAFDQLSAAYTRQFGTPICVTDSYRSYPAQVSVYARKPGLAAVPGTSNHGWGTAVDLCGGIQSFTSAQHLWMLVNAPLYNWFHPGWAQAGGSKPEPWHWEFSG